jgi:hypothetical protein
MAVVSVCCIAFFSIRHLAMKGDLQEAYEAEAKRLRWDCHIESELEHELQCSQRALETEQSKVRCLLEQRMQLQSDINCFRAELGLGQRANKFDWENVR